MKLTTTQSRKLKQNLPSNYCQLIREQLVEKKTPISARHILNIINGDSHDNYGVIDIATEMALEVKRERKKMERKLNKL